MQLASNEIHIWTCDLSLVSKPRDLNTLSAEELERANRFHFAIHRERFIAARYALRKILSKYLDLTPEAVSFDYTTHGKPYLPGEGVLQFNLAHSHNMAVYAITQQDPIGIDIEYMRPTYNADIIQRFCSSAEKEAFHQLPLATQREHFYCLWSRKEAVIKATGKGLAFNLSEFTVSVYPETETVALADQFLTLIPLSIHSDYQCTVAYQQSTSEPKIIQQMCF